MGSFRGHFQVIVERHIWSLCAPANQRRNEPAAGGDHALLVADVDVSSAFIVLVDPGLDALRQVEGQPAGTGIASRCHFPLRSRTGTAPPSTTSWAGQGSA